MADIIQEERELLEAEKAGHITIFIDRKRLVAPRTEMTGTELKALGGVKPDFCLYLEVPGPGDDRRITDNETIVLKSGMKFFSTPCDLNPGSRNAASRAR